MSDDRARARALAEESLRGGDCVGWFETLYLEAGGDWARVPWADLQPNPHLVEWLPQEGAGGTGRHALVIGCGLGDDAEAVADRGYRTIAFDVAPTAIEACRRRFPETPVAYVVADLFSHPPEWAGAFDLVVEVNTLQALPAAPRAHAMRRIARLPAPRGTLLVLARGREPDEDPGRMPWPLTRGELAGIEETGLIEDGFEDFLDDEAPPVRRFRVTYRHPG